MYIALCAAYSRRPAVKRDVVAAATADRDCEHLSILSPLKVQAARHSLPLHRLATVGRWCFYRAIY